MKSLKLSVFLTLFAAIVATGCGHNNDTPTTPGAGGGGVYGGGVIPAPGTTTIPITGSNCYYNPYSGYGNGYNTGGYTNGYNAGYNAGYGGYGTTGCSSCPAGYIQSGASCIISSAAGSSCPVGTSWSGYGCMPSSFTGCPSGTVWSWQYQGCVGVYGSGYSVPNYNGYYCYAAYSGGYVCNYTQGAPSGYGYGGYGYIRLSF